MAKGYFRNWDEVVCACGCGTPYYLKDGKGKDKKFSPLCWSRRDPEQRSSQKL